MKSHRALRRLEEGLYNHFSVGYMAEIKASWRSFSNSASEAWVSGLLHTEKEAQVLLLFRCLEIIKRRRKAKYHSCSKQQNGCISQKLKQM